MTKFKVEFLPTAKRDLDISVEWGASYWEKRRLRNGCATFIQLVGNDWDNFP